MTTNFIATFQVPDRRGHGSTFFNNRWLWLSLAGVLALQALVVHWAPAVAVSSSVLLEETRKLAALAFARRPAEQPNHNTQGDK